MHQFTQRLVSETLNKAAPAMISRLEMGTVHDIDLSLSRFSQCMTNPSGQGFVLAGVCGLLKQFAIFGIHAHRHDVVLDVALRQRSSSALLSFRALASCSLNMPAIATWTALSGDVAGGI
jgi:hypothetical protein